jgi:hypothetical protein
MLKYMNDNSGKHVKIAFKAFSRLTPRRCLARCLVVGRRSLVGRLHVRSRANGRRSVQRLCAYFAVCVRWIRFEPDDYHYNKRHDHNDQSHDYNIQSHDHNIQSHDHNIQSHDCDDS